MNYVKKHNNSKAMKKIAYGGKLSEGGALDTFMEKSSIIPYAGAITSLVGGLSHMKDAEKAKAEMIGNIIQQKRTTDGQALANYQPQGNAGVQYYAKGGKVKPLSNLPTKGKFNTTGGELVPISNNAEVAEGNEHGESKIDGQSGILLHDGNKPVAEIEDQEVVVGNEQVFSDRLLYNGKITFADKAKAIQTKAGKVEEKLEHTTDSKEHTGLQRMLDGYKVSTDKLFNEQEVMKHITGKNNVKAVVPKAALGMRLPGNRFAALPSSKRSDRPKDEADPEGNSVWENLKPNLIDNGVNAILTATSPKLAKPILSTPANLNTTINVNPQLAEITDNVAGTTDNIIRNTSDANTARNNIASSRLSGLKAKLGVLGQKENIETQLKNADITQKNAVANANVDKANENISMNFVRANDIQSRISGNVADLSKNIGEAQTRKDYQDYYDEDMLLSLLDDKTGDKARVMARNPYLAKNPRLAKAIQNEANRKASYTPYSFKSQVSNTLFK